MFPIAVVVDIQPPPAAHERAVVAERCSAVLHPASVSCAVLGDGARDPEPNWFVGVVWGGDQLDNAEVSLYDSKAGRTFIRTQRLSFQSASPELERWAAVGLVVAAMTTSAEREEKAGQAASETPVPGPAEPGKQPARRPREVPRESPYRWRLGLAPTLGSALTPSTLAVGGTARLGLRIGDASVEPVCAVSYSQAQGPADLRFFEAAAGAEVPIAGEAFSLRLRGELNWVHVQATAEAAGQRASAGVSRFGAELGVTAVAPYAKHHAVWAGAGASARWPQVDISLRDQLLTTGALVGYRLAFGLEFWF